MVRAALMKLNKKFQKIAFIIKKRDDLHVLFRLFSCSVHLLLIHTPFGLHLFFVKLPEKRIA